MNPRFSLLRACLAQSLQSATGDPLPEFKSQHAPHFVTFDTLLNLRECLIFLISKMGVIIDLPEVSYDSLVNILVHKTFKTLPGTRKRCEVIIITSLLQLSSDPRYTYTHPLPRPRPPPLFSPASLWSSGLRALRRGSRGRAGRWRRWEGKVGCRAVEVAACWPGRGARGAL